MDRTPEGKMSCERSTKREFKREFKREREREFKRERPRERSRERSTKREVKREVKRESSRERSRGLREEANLSKNINEGAIVSKDLPTKDETDGTAVCAVFLCEIFFDLVDGEVRSQLKGDVKKTPSSEEYVHPFGLVARERGVGALWSLV